MTQLQVNSLVRTAYSAHKFSGEYIVGIEEMKIMNSTVMISDTWFSLIFECSCIAIINRKKDALYDFTRITENLNQSQLDSLVDCFEKRYSKYHDKCASRLTYREEDEKHYIFI